MARSVFLRYVGMACILSSICWLLGVLVGAFALISGMQSGAYAIDSPTFPAVLFPLIWLPFLSGLGGLYVYLGARATWIGRVGILMASLGILMKFLGEGGIAWGRPLGLWVSSDCTREPSRCQLLSFLLTLSMRGYLLFGLGLILVGAGIVRQRLLVRWNALPLAIGITAVAAYCCTDEGPLQRLGMTSLGTAIAAAVFGLFLIIWGGGWLLIGSVFSFDRWQRCEQW